MQNEPGGIAGIHLIKFRISALRYQQTKEIRMKDRVMLGLWRFMLKAPASMMEKSVAREKKKFEAAKGFMTEEHRRVHHCVVRELPVLGKPLSPEFIAKKLDLPVERVASLLDDLEEHMTFLFRNKNREVIWAYPVTVDKTPHRVTFSSGEQLYAA